MKILIAYYSRTGGTEKLAQALKKEFETRGHSVDVEKVKPIKEHSFLGWWHIRMVKGDCEIYPQKIWDVSKYDAICIGSPNWTRLSLPMAKYLQKIEGLKYKKIGFFAATAAPPAFEWYILSAYLLDLTFTRIIEQKRGRIIESILLSSLFKNWGVDSEYGKRAIKNFCDKIKTPIFPLKDYFLNRKEIKNNRLLVIAFSTLLVSSLILHIVLPVFNKGFLSWAQYSYLAATFFFSILLLTTIHERKIGILLGKYIGGFSAVLLWTLTMVFAQPTLGRVMILGYILIFVLFGFFHNPKVVIFSGLFSFLGYGILFYNPSLKEILNPGLDLVLIGISCGAVASITGSLQKYHFSLLDSQEEIETAKAVLEIKVEARTRELRELTEGQEEMIKERTKELQEKINELGKFSRLAVGRELKMVTLKEEIEKLKKELEKSKGRPN
ncbi:MAG: hypothetical protein COS09_00145 [Candidatus Nealsonbacteria bacterium CG01_land_8_20_14_3_00_12]|uniref:Flavodoxin-like domain-containing protein n=3 Tax=Candidatus Nealsoniibacteriota TaxID=1817911 RepID=A0A2M7EC55_9BACT|nr:MAG: hypothetical protein COS09_00145 [Candidatus Nealsonbacteria bacterium CG01_land_8_20_14_3_00_12]